MEANSPLGSLQGTDNILQISSGIYSHAPLVLQGAGAGVGVTALGVVSELVDVAIR